MSGRLRGSVFCALLSSSLFTSLSFASTTQVQVVYLVQDAAITTYDVSAANGNATKISTLTLNSSQSVLAISPAPRDHYAYVMWVDNRGNQSLSVFATTPQGALRSPAVQTISASNFQNFAVDPNGCFAYALLGWINKQRQYVAQIALFSIDESSGKLTKSKDAQAKYGPSRYGVAGLDGFNARGTKLFDVWGNVTRNSYAYDYNSHWINSKTGELDSDVAIFRTAGVTGDVNAVSIGDSLIAQNYIASGDPSNSWINVFSHPLSKEGQPLITCTSSMLDLCGNANTLSALLDPAGKNLFLTPGWNNPTQSTSVVQIDLANKKLVSTESSIPSQFGSIYFGPDGSIVYGVQWSTGTSTVQIYTFNAASGKLTEGGQINAQASFLYTAIRQ